MKIFFREAFCTGCEEIRTKIFSIGILVQFAPGQWENSTRPHCYRLFQKIPRDDDNFPIGKKILKNAKFSKMSKNQNFSKFKKMFKKNFSELFFKIQDFIFMNF
jgi:hypothetical protein